MQDTTNPVDIATSSADESKAKGQTENEPESFTYIAPRATVRHAVSRHTRPQVPDDEAPLIDTTEVLPKRSRKTERLQRQREQKLKRTTVKSETKSFLELPPELLEEVLLWLQPSDISRLLCLNHATRDFIREHELSITRGIIRHRYPILTKAFYLPLKITNVDPAAYPSLLSSRWQQMLVIHKRPYQHIRSSDPMKVCSCTACVLAWNNLCLILDLAYFQKFLQNREIIPRIRPGERPEWNTQLIEDNACIVERAMSSQLIYAMILERHLRTIVATLTREARVGRRVWKPKRLFDLSDDDIAAGTDEFLRRKGPPSWEFPYQRDKYLDLQAYVPNRTWSKEKEEWQYPPPLLHNSDVAMVAARFQPDPPRESDNASPSLLQQLEAHLCSMHV